MASIMKKSPIHFFPQGYSQVTMDIITIPDQMVEWV